MEAAEVFSSPHQNFSHILVTAELFLDPFQSTSCRLQDGNRLDVSQGGLGSTGGLCLLQTHSLNIVHKIVMGGGGD